MRNDNNIRDIFNNSSLDEQDWLEPSDSIFQSIESAVYPDEDKKKPIWLWLILSLTLLVLLSSLLYAVTLRDISDDTPLRENHNHQILDTSTIPTDDTVSMASDNSSIVDLEEQSHQDLISNEISVNKKDISQTVNENIAPQQKSKNITSTYKKSLVSVGVKKPIIKENLSPTINSVLNQANKKSANSREVVTLSNIAVLNLIASEPLSSKRALPIISMSESPTDHQLDKSFTFNVGAGTSIWNYNLNENYVTALSPADFTHTSGTGTVIQLGIEKRSSKLLSIRANVSYESVSFQSGHNSNITYRNVDENADNENNFNLDMATPLGGINSSIAVRRNLDSSPSENTLSIALHNQHNYKNIDLTISSLQHLFENNKWNINTEIGLGYNQTFALTNNLSAVDLNDTAYSITSINESSTQMNLNLSRAHMLLGINAGINISETTGINFAYAHKRDLSSVFNSGDFNTTLTRHQFVFSVMTKF